MTAKTKTILKTIGYVASFLPFAAISALFCYVIYESNQVFFYNLLSSSTMISTTAVIITSDALFYLISASAVLFSILAIVKRKEKRYNQIALWAPIAVCIVGLITFIVLCHLVGTFLVSLEHINLYLAYLLFSLLANALPLYASLHHLIKLKRRPITFAKNTESSAKADDQ